MESSNGAGATAVSGGREAADTLVRQRIEASIAICSELLDSDVVDVVADVARHLITAYQHGNKVLFFGNGGSAADATHLAAEMCGRFLIDRRALPAIALADNVATTTAIGNDYGFNEVFARQVEGFGAAGDVAVGISTSGQSENVIKALEAAQRMGLWTVGLTGAAGGRLADVADVCVRVPSNDIPRIQEIHTLVGHIICELVEGALFAAEA